MAASLGIHDFLLNELLLPHWCWGAENRESTPERIERMATEKTHLKTTVRL